MAAGNEDNLRKDRRATYFELNLLIIVAVFLTVQHS